MTKDQTRKKLRDAVVAEAIEHGFSATSVAGVVQRAGTSAGTVYVHFRSKEDMLQKVFLEIKNEFHATMMDAQGATNSASMVEQMWINMFAFVRAQPADFLYLEFGNSARILTPSQEQDAARMTAEIAQMLQTGIDDGTLADVGVDVISLLLVSPALQLARQSVQHGRAIPQSTIDIMFDRVWRAIARDG